jgi:hypothetical protein
MTLVVDASIAAQWVLDQEVSARAMALRKEGGLIAPSLVAAEIGSAIWKAVNILFYMVRRAGLTQCAELLSKLTMIAGYPYKLHFRHWRGFECFFYPETERRDYSTYMSLGPSHGHHTGKLSCLRPGISTVLPRSIAKARAIRGRVADGMMTSSI